MARVGRYCKAYSIHQLRTFSGWSEKSEKVRRKEKTVDQGEEEVDGQRTEDRFLFVQENHVVTDGIFIDENIVFDDITPEWQSFCQDTLKFQVPQHTDAEENE